MTIFPHKKTSHLETAATPQLPPIAAGSAVAHYLHFRRDPFGFWLTLGRTAAVTRLQLPLGWAFWVVSDEAWVDRILAQQSYTYLRSRYLTDTKRRGTPPNLTQTRDWKQWLWKRRLMQPPFHKERLAAFGETIVQETNTLIADWGERGHLTDVGDEFRTLTIRLITKLLYAGSEADAHIFRQTLDAYMDFGFRRATSLIHWPLWLPLPAHRRVARLRQQAEEAAWRLVLARMEGEETAEPNDLLDMLLAIFDPEAKEGEEAFTLEQIIHHLGDLTVAGYETTALGLTWLFYFVSTHPEVEARLRDEVETVLQGRPPTAADVSRLPYLNMVILETLRLRPPVFVMLREADKADDFGGYHVPAGTQIFLNVAALHRDPRYWATPEAFNPDHFTAEAKAQRPHGAFTPFSIGPRKCLGDGLALLEMNLIVPLILQRYQLSYSGTEPLRVKPGVRLQAEPLPMRIERK